MQTIASDYRWKEGLPVPVGKCPVETGYKIVKDPYYKHVSIEAYEHGHFTQLVYDSRLLDFRYLRPVDQVGWQKTPLSVTETLIRDREDRVVYREEYIFEQGFCRRCTQYSPHGILLSTTALHYTPLGDAFNGAILYDANDRPVLQKTYALEEGLFTTLLEEKRDMPPITY